MTDDRAPANDTLAGEVLADDVVALLRRVGLRVVTAEEARRQNAPPPPPLYPPGDGGGR